MSGAFAVVVDFLVHPERVDEFRSAMLKQAKDSLDLEEGCLQFDVFTDSASPETFVLYELYRDEQAFEEHLASKHLADFSARVGPMVKERVIRRLHRAG
jgi:quinol monooxygenase YgiN